MQLLQRHTPVIPPSYSELLLGTPSPPAAHTIPGSPEELSATTSTQNA